LIVLLFGLLDLKPNLKSKFVSPKILIGLFLLFAILSPDSSDGNDTYMAPLSVLIAQITLFIFEWRIKKTKTTNE